MSTVLYVNQCLFTEQNCYSRKIWKYDLGDYTKYRQLLTEYNWHDILVGDVDTVASKVTSVILESATKSIPNKMVTIRPKDPPWMRNEIRKLIRRRMRLHRQAKSVNKFGLNFVDYAI